MKQFVVTAGQRDQRLDKYLKRVLPKAPSSFIYKMLRKKNIKWNDHKADGSELIAEGDVVTLYLSDETFAKFAAEDESDDGQITEYREAFEALQKKIDILYEDDQILLAIKPAGVLSQKAAPKDRSLNEWFVGYLLSSGEISSASLKEFVPSICNRLDRNTSGIVICAKTLLAGRKMTKLLRDRSLQKYYQMVVIGKLEPSHGVIEGYLIKNSEKNTVTMEKSGKASDYTKTIYESLHPSKDGKLSLVEAELVTGKTHQLRAHLSSIGHPILGDSKYGDAAFNEKYRSRGVRSQLLCCVRVCFPELSEKEFRSISGRTFAIKPPAVFTKL